MWTAGRDSRFVKSEHNAFNVGVHDVDMKNGSLAVLTVLDDPISGHLFFKSLIPKEQLHA